MPANKNQSAMQMHKDMEQYVKTAMPKGMSKSMKQGKMPPKKMSKGMK